MRYLVLISCFFSLAYGQKYQLPDGVSLPAQKLDNPDLEKDQQGKHFEYRLRVAPDADREISSEEEEDAEETKDQADRSPSSKKEVKEKKTEPGASYWQYLEEDE